ncbi:hypothetical protein L7F22_050602 [Adiantum nelumboides]|nr:hypothetical protein [Adiantum nelumboides]
MIFVKDSLNDVDETQVNENGMQVDLELSNFLNEFQDVFIDDIPGELPPKRGDDDHMIELIPGSSPPNKPPYRVSQAQQEEIMKQVNELVEKGMVRPSSSPFCSLVLLVQKKDGTYQCEVLRLAVIRHAKRKAKLSHIPAFIPKINLLQGMQSEEKRDALSSPASQQNPSPSSCPLTDSSSDKQQLPRKKPRKKKKNSSASPHWGCFHTFYWLLGFVCFFWWVVLVLYRSLPSLSKAISGPLPDSPGDALRKQGLHAHHPVVFVPGTVTGGLELWEGHPCTNGMFRRGLQEASLLATAHGIEQ